MAMSLADLLTYMVLMNRKSPGPGVRETHAHVQDPATDLLGDISKLLPHLNLSSLACKMGILSPNTQGCH